MGYFWILFTRDDLTAKGKKCITHITTSTSSAATSVLPQKWNRWRKEKRKLFGFRSQSATEKDADRKRKQADRRRQKCMLSNLLLCLSVQFSSYCLAVEDLCFIGFEILFLELCTHPARRSLYDGCRSQSTEQQTAAVILDLLTKPYCTNTKSQYLLHTLNCSHLHTLDLPGQEQLEM